MRIRNYILLTVLFALFVGFRVSAANWEELVNLKGSWRFSVGDNSDWLDPEYDDSNWDQVAVPNNWDKYYKGYNGFGWYRKTFQMRWIPEQGQVAVNLGKIDDVDEVFLNGVKIGQSGSFFPDFVTAYDIERRYIIPRELLRKGENTIAVRVYDIASAGGICWGNHIGIHYDTDYTLLSVNLSGTWKFTIERDGKVYALDYNDSHWDDIQVPSFWENQGYANYDGYAWYRKEFTVPTRLKDERLYLVLGRIDDMDRVYLNGEPFARTEYLDDYNRFNQGNAYRLYRVYRLPSNKIKSKNILAVEVKDTGIGGGIYEGPIGIVTEQDAKVILSRNRDDFWSNPFEYFIRSIFD